ncbi:MAG: neutral/alkaline non-lysosomal ceramidase N-terminal domain-containing protein [Bacteroidales bacterium]|nr:neutral/alkaline non-lysosomal ceramidase N-terminal domain-containing protein [Bacteroidales bacterium]
MKKFGIISGILIMSLIILFFIFTDPVNNTSYFESEYFKQSCARIDSLKEKTSTVNDSIKAGFARVSITPVLNNSEDNYLEGKFIQLPLAGFGDRKGKPATGVHDSIFVKAVALRVNSQILVFVSADLLIMPPNITDSLVNLLSRKGIRREQLVLSATHSHSSLGGWGPGFIGKQFAGNENKNLEKWLVLQISRVVTSAISDLKPARIGTGSFNAESYTRNRVIGESGTKNNDFSFIIVEQSGHKKAIIGSFSAHATTIGSDNMEISADYPGYWERKIEDTSADLALFFAGSIGSQSPVGKGDKFDKSKFIGEALADSVNVYLPHVVLNDKITFSFISLKMQLPDYHIRLTTKINLSSFWSTRLMPPPGNVYLQAIRINNAVWITTPSDFSGEYALQLKNALAAEGFDSNVSSFNGSYVGYIVPGRYFYLDEYESKMMGWFGPNMGEYTMDLIRQISEIVTDSDNL